MQSKEIISNAINLMLLCVYMYFFTGKHQYKMMRRGTIDRNANILTRKHITMTYPSPSVGHCVLPGLWR